MIEGGQITRWIVLAALSLATAVMFAVSIRGNYLYGVSLGQTPEKRELFGWANVAADMWKAFGLIAVSLLWRTQHRRAASIASVGWLMCLLFGINSALGIYVQDRAALTGTREARHATFKVAEKELGSIEEKLRRRAQERSLGEIDAAINSVLGRPVIAGDRVRGTVAVVSRDCTMIDMRTNEPCRELAQLREERAMALEVRILEQGASALREQIIVLRDRGGSIAPDPVGEFYAWVTGGVVSVRDVGFGFPLFFALLIEVISAFGPLTIAAYAEASRPSASRKPAVEGAPKLAMAGHDQVRQATAGHGETEEGHVVLWIAERAIPIRGNSAIDIEELYEDYQLWCVDQGLRARSISLFENEFDHVRGLPELAGKIRKFGNRYYGLGLLRRGGRAIASGRNG